MLAHVPHSLLGHSVERRLHRGRQSLRAQAFVVGDRPAFVAQRIDLQPDGGRQPEVVKDRRPQASDHPPRLADRLLRQHPELRDLLPHLRRAWVQVRG